MKRKVKVTDKKTYLVFSQDENLHEYTITVEIIGNKTKFSLFFSNGHQWADGIRNKLRFTMIDDGWAMIIEPLPSKFDYSELDCIRLLINFRVAIDNHKPNKIPYKVVEAINPMEV